MDKIQTATVLTFLGIVGLAWIGLMIYRLLEAMHETLKKILSAIYSVKEELRR